MKLSRRHIQAGADRAKQHGISTENPEQVVQYAFEAIMVGGADEAAYAVTEAAGAVWITPHVYWPPEQEARPRMTVETAREIIKQALEDEAWEGEEPEADDKAISIAEELITMAQDAFDQGVKGDEVMALLNIAARDSEDSTAEDDDEPVEEKPTAKRRGRPSRAETEAKKASTDPRALQEPWDGYVNDGVVAVIEGIDVWAEDGELDGVRHILMFEEEHKNRKRVVERIREILSDDESLAEDEETPEPTEDPEEVDAEPVEDDDKDDAEETEEAGEPFESYSTLKMAEIKEALEEYLENDEVEDDDKIATINLVIAYETANKNRTSLLNALNGYMSSYNESEDDEQEAETETKGKAKAAAASEPDEDAEEADSGGKNSGKASRTPSRKRTPSTGKSSGDDSESDEAYYVVSAPLNGSTLHYNLTGKYSIAGTVLDLIDSGASSISIKARDDG